MKSTDARVLDLLNRQFISDHPASAARELESLSLEDALIVVRDQPVAALLRLWPRLTPDVGARLLRELSPDQGRALLTDQDPTVASRSLGQLDPEERTRLLDLLEDRVADGLRQIMTFPEGTAGRLMDPRVSNFREDATVDDVITRLRRNRNRRVDFVYVVDDDGYPTGQVSIHDIALGDSVETLGTMMKPIRATVSPLTPQDEIVEILQARQLFELPVLDARGRLAGVVRQATLTRTIQDEASADIQTMVGVDATERALSSPLVAVRKRLFWLEINLLTAFLAASVVGAFESTIAQFTALAVLLPVVAGQSGNAGSQALAVTMRGLAVREITVRHWFVVARKEAATGFLNGVAIALTTGLGVLIWSGSIGLGLVIAISMVLSMVAAGFSGAIVPMALVRLGQDPAQSSSIILTTVTDIAGFLSFLGIATLMASML